jgi:antibiotic biosynthesis monooxygenase (ABM) superfamily enzyme
MYDITEAEYDSVLSHRAMDKRRKEQEIQQVIDYARLNHVNIWLRNPDEPVSMSGWKITVFVESVVIVLLLLFK